MGCPSTGGGMRDGRVGEGAEVKLLDCSITGLQPWLWVLVQPHPAQGAFTFPRKTLPRHVTGVCCSLCSPREWMGGEKSHSLWSWTQTEAMEMRSVCTAPPIRPLCLGKVGRCPWSYQEGGLSLPWIPHTHLYPAVVVIEASVALPIPLHCELHFLECVCSPAQAHQPATVHRAPGLSLAWVRGRATGLTNRFCLVLFASWWGVCRPQGLSVLCSPPPSPPAP